jgi:hypothetical protein
LLYGRNDDDARSKVFFFHFIQSGDESVKESVLSALKGVIKHAGKSVSSAIRSRGCALLEDLLQAEADDVRSCAAKVIGTLSQVMINLASRVFLVSSMDVKSLTTSEIMLLRGCLNAIELIVSY